jgi:excisionase family DNA binding protein
MSIERKPLRDIDYPVERTGFSEWRIWKMCRDGAIPHVRFGRRVKFDVDQLEEWIKNGGTGPQGVNG